jgi:hypothetical protein
MAQGAHAKRKPKAATGPPPRFMTVKRIDLSKGEVVFDIQVVQQNALDQPTILVYPDGHTRLTLGTKPSHIHLGEGFKVALKKVKWRGVDGKPVDSKTVSKRLKPGVTVLLSADGAEVDPSYLRLFKADVLTLIVPADELPVPYNPQVGGAIPIQEVGAPGGER